MDGFSGVRAALCWYHNESNSFFPSVTGACCELAALTDGLRRSPSPWKKFKDNGAQYKCEHCGRMVRVGDSGARYHLRRSKKAGGDVLAWYCQVCGEQLMDLSSKFVRGYKEFENGGAIADVINARMDIERMLALIPEWKQEVLFAVSQSSGRDWSGVYATVRRVQKDCRGKSEETLRRRTALVLQEFENALRVAGYVTGGGDYGVPHLRVISGSTTRAPHLWRPKKAKTPAASLLDSKKPEVMKGLDAGLTQEALAEKLGVSLPTLERFLRKHHEWISHHGPCTNEQAAREFSKAVGEDEDLAHFITLQAHTHWQRLRESYPEIEFEEVYAEFLVAASEALPQFAPSKSKRETFLRHVFKNHSVSLERNLLAA